MEFPQLDYAIRQGHSVDAASWLYFEQVGKDADTNLQGCLRGPYSDYAKTLAAEFKLQLSDDDRFAAGVVITDPCYWTPELPFLYHLTLDGYPETHFEVGIRRWGTDGPHLRLEGKRTVLRGGRISEFGKEDISTVRDTKSALIMEGIDREKIESAARQGVSLLLDLRGIGERFLKELPRLSWCPAISVVLLDSEQFLCLDSHDINSTQILFAECITTNTESTAELNKYCNLLALHLRLGETPPSWINEYHKPIIAIREQMDYEGVAEMRTFSDRLQAELAPTFDLAGYFVTP